MAQSNHDKLKSLERELMDAKEEYRKLKDLDKKLVAKNWRLRQQNMNLVAENFVFAAEIKNGMSLLRQQPEVLMDNLTKLKNGGFNGLIDKLWIDNSWKEKCQTLMAEVANLREKEKAKDLKYRNVMDDCKRSELNYQNLEKEHNELKKKFTELKKKKDYKSWDAMDFTNWILMIDDGRYAKYNIGNALFAQIEKQGIKGQHIKEMDKGDLHRIGIVDFKDKKDLMEQIQRLEDISKSQNKEVRFIEEQQEGQNDTDIM